MKIYRKIVIEIATGRVLEEDSFEYHGPIAEAKGGGGASGAVDYPAYQKSIQADWLAGGGYDDISSLNDLDAGNDITSLLNASIGSSPFTTLDPYNPATRLADMEGTVDGMLAQIQSALSDYSVDIDGVAGIFRYIQGVNFYEGDESLDDLETYIDSITTTSQVETELAAYDESQNSIGAIGSSAWAIGRLIVASMVTETRLKARVELARLKDAKAKTIGAFNVDRESKIAAIQADAKKFALNMLAESINKVSGLDIEVQRLAIIALKEEMEKSIKLAKQDALWDLTVFGVGANVMASIAGGTVSQDVDTPSDTQSAIAGGLSGAAAGGLMAAGGSFGSAVVGGAMAGGPAGAMVGAALGIGASFL